MKSLPFLSGNGVSCLRSLAAAGVFTGLFGLAANAEVRLASPFTDHMVLQRGMAVPVWGEADPGEKVTVEFGAQRLETTAAADGSWRVDLAPLTASAEPAELVVTGSATPAPLRLSDVLVGEVWLASGQSNMDFTVARTEKYYFAGVLNEAEEVAAANHPRIRMFTGQWKKSHEPERRVGGEWKICTPETVREFSAVGYFFARRLREDIDVPVGIVTLTFGASSAQAWVRREAALTDPRTAAELAKYDAAVEAFRTDPAILADYETKLAAWKELEAAAKAKGERPPRGPRHPDPVQNQHNPTVMFNGMIAPVVPFALRGVIWYQGESIPGPRELFPVWNEILIRDWRALWGREFPFYFVQLASLDARSNSPEVRALQAQALRLPNTGMAVTIDAGDKKDVHPKNKQAVGDRLARLALARTYGVNVPDSGPVAVGVARTESGELRVRFEALHGGLAAKDGPLGGFQVAGADGAFSPAEARIEGGTVVLRAPAGMQPVSARYAWASWPEGANLVNAAGLPAAPFSLTVQP